MKQRLPIYSAVIVVLLCGIAALLYFGMHTAKTPTPTVPQNIQPKQSDQEQPTAQTPQEVQDVNTTPLTIAKGWSISYFAKNLTAPRVLAIAPNSNVVLASIPSQGKVVALPDSNHDGVADKTVTVVDHLNAPHGLAFVCNPTCLLYIAETNRISEYSYDDATYTATFKRQVASLPTGGRHTTRTLLPEPTSNYTNLLVSIGSSCDTCNETDSRRASIMLLDLSKSQPTLTPYASGLRNSVFMQINPYTKKVWATEMGRDNLGDNIPPDEVNIIEQGKNYGWPNCYGKDIHDDVFDKKTYIRNPCMEPFETESHIDIPAHSAPLGLAFTDDSMGDQRNQLLVSYHGSWNRSTPTGYKVEQFSLNDDGSVKNNSDFITGFIDTKQTIIGRPVDILFGPDHAFYISDDKAGVIYRVWQSTASNVLTDTPSTNPKPDTKVEPIVSEPVVNAEVHSPLKVTGTAPGNWYFEASFPIQIKDELGTVIASMPAQAQGDWMTDSQVPFEISIPFRITKKQKGTLVLNRDNPSGLAQNEQHIEIPITLVP